MRSSGSLGFLSGLVVAVLAAWGAEPAGPVRDLRSRFPAVRAHAAVTLGRLGDRSAVPALTAALTDKNAAVRREVIAALAVLRDARAVDALVKALDDPDTTVRFKAAYALGEIRDARAVDALLNALRDPEWCVRDQAAWALRAMCKPGLIPSILAALNSGEADTEHLIWILRGLGAEELLDPLREMLKAPDVQTRLRAVMLVGRLVPRRGTRLLLAALKDSDPEMRRRTVETLTGNADERVREALAGLLDGERDAAVRRAVENALWQASPQRHLAAWWNFEDTTGNLARDVTGHGNNGQIKNGSVVPGKSGRALRFQRGSHIEFGRPEGLPVMDKSWTVMAWVRSNAAEGVVVARGGAACGFSLYLKDGTPRFGIHRESDGPGYVARSEIRTVGSWVHLAGVVRPDRIELYVDGKLAAAKKTPGVLPNNCGQGMEIGFDLGNSAAEITTPFDGIIDEVKFFDAVLSERDIVEASETTTLLQEEKP